MRKLILIFVLLISMLFISGASFAQDEEKSAKSENKEIQKKSDSIKIGVVDVDRITFESKSMKNLIKEMENTIKIKQDELNKKKNQYDELKKKIEQQKEILNEDEANKKNKELMKLSEEMADLKYDIDKTMKRSEKESIEPALDRILEGVRKVAEDKRLDIVIRSDLLLYRNPSCDITKEVIDKIDELTEKNPIPVLKK